MLAALSAPIFLTIRARIRLVLFGIVAAALAVSGIVFVSSWLEDGYFLELIYGRDFIREIEQGNLELIYQFQGGTRRAGALATLGNPEFTGTHLAIGFLLVGCGLLHGWGWKTARSWPLWPVWLLALGLVGSGILASGTRGALLAVGIGLLVCWLGSFRIRGWWIAAGLGVCVLAGLMGGVRAAMIVAALALGGALAWQIASGQFIPKWRAIGWPNRVLLLLAPVVLVVGMTSQSVPGPWNIGGATLVERLTRETTMGDDSIRERITFWMMAGEIVAKRPVLGVGEGMFGPNFHPALVKLVEADATGTMAYNQRLLKTWLAFEAHNDYFEIAADRGLLGLALFLGLAVALLGGLARLAREDNSPHARLAHAALVTLGGFYAMMATSFPFQTPARMTTFFLVVGVSLAILAIREDDAQECPPTSAPAPQPTP